MQTEAGFLDAIASNPEDDALRLIYADWLEEQGDPRAEYLRLEVQYHQLLAQTAPVREQLQELPEQIQTVGGRFDQSWIDHVTPLRRVVLCNYPRAHKLLVIKLIYELFRDAKEFSGNRLLEAKNLAESLPATIKDHLTPSEAEEIRRRFAPRADVVVEIEPHRLVVVRPLNRVLLLAFPAAQKLEVIKLIREITNLGLKESKDLSESLPATIKDYLTLGVAEQIRRRFEPLATVVIEPDAVGG
jgi:uncharacterized protein (TIGR02996 family)